jgi:hypothetical protein
MEQISTTIVPISSSSRYRNTRMYKDMTMNSVYFGSWRPPKILERRRTSIHIVVVDELHRPDLISFRVYARSDMFWAIAIRNGILMPLVDMAKGQPLTCPHIEDILTALSMSTSLSIGTV